VTPVVRFGIDNASLLFLIFISFFDMNASQNESEVSQALLRPIARSAGTSTSQSFAIFPMKYILTQGARSGPRGVFWE
jgi:hypothetical protein